VARRPSRIEAHQAKPTLANLQAGPRSDLGIIIEPFNSERARPEEKAAWPES
jgi:hypothetical protein